MNYIGINNTDQIFQMETNFHKQLSIQEKKPILRQQLVIGYYNLRGKAQVCRLICQYLQVNYKDKLYTLSSWDKFKKKSNHHWCFTDLPYIKEGDFVVTEAVPICQYIVNRFGPASLLGKNQKDRATVGMYLWTIQSMTNVITINCQRSTKREGLENFKRKQWNTNVFYRLHEYEKAASNEQWFLGYLTIIDFSIYQLMKHMRLIFPLQIVQFSKLITIQKQISSLSSITAYQQSCKAITQTNPTSLLQQLQRQNNYKN